MIFFPPPDPVLKALTPEARKVLAHPDRVTAYAVDVNAFIEKPALGFADALAARRLSKPEGKRAIVAFYAALRSAQPNVFPSCFDPHHGLKIERGKRWVKVWICYICRQTEIQESGGQHITVASGLEGRATLDKLVPQVARRSAPKPEP